jgi:hypothetical protein
MLTKYSPSILRIPLAALPSSSNSGLLPRSSTHLFLLPMACSVNSPSLPRVRKLSDLVNNPDQSCTDLYPYLRPEIAHPQPGGMWHLPYYIVVLTSLGQPTSLPATTNNHHGNMPADNPGAFIGVSIPPGTEKGPVKARKPKDPNAPKKPRGRPRKDAAQASARQDTDASTSDSGSDELQILEMPESTPDLLRAPRPDGPEDQVIYDVAVAVWSPRNKPAVAEKVRKGIALFGDVVKQQRDAWKVKNEALKQAELANTAAIPSLKQEVAQFRRTIQTMATQALLFGHPAHLAKYVFIFPPFSLLLHLPVLEYESTRSLYSHVASSPVYEALKNIASCS